MTLDRPLGAFAGESGVIFRVFSTTATSVAVRLFSVPKPGADPTAGAAFPLTALGDGLFEGVVGEAGPGSLYKLELDGSSYPDPYARFLPFDVHGPARVERSKYEWKHPAPVRPLSEHVLYELHVGTFTPEGTYASAATKLLDLVNLGVTAIELMPIAAFAGTRGWGYDGVALYAPFAGYGTPDELRAFVDEAHRLGLSVFLDVVYNHLGPAGNYLRAYAPEYFTAEVKNAWGDAPNFAHPVVRRWVLDNARLWLDDFRFDGLRLDATHAIGDPSARPILSELATEVAKLEPKKHLVAEDERNDPKLLREWALDAVWADDFHHQLHVTLTGDRDGYYAAYEPGAAGIARAISRGWLYEGAVYTPWNAVRGAPAGDLPAERFVYCIQNHDQIGNRALGERLHHLVSLDAWLAASMLLLFLPMIPLLYMGQEWAASSRFLYFTDHEPGLGELVRNGRREEFKSFAAFADPERRAAIPDPQSAATFAASKLRWEERTKPDHARSLALYRDLLALRRSDPVLAGSGREGLHATAEGEVLTVRRRKGSDVRALVVNFGEQPRACPELSDAPRLLLASTGSAASPEARSTLEPHQALLFSS